MRSLTLLVLLVICACSSDPETPTGPIPRRDVAYDLARVWCDNEVACGNETTETWGACVETVVDLVFCTEDVDCDALIDDLPRAIDAYNCYHSLRNFACGDEPVCDRGF